MSTKAIVTKIDETLAPSSFDVTPFKKPKAGENMSFEVNVIAESDDKMKKTAIMEPNLPSWGTFSITCDEGLALGGEDTAPPPLGYLASGIAFCLLTHLSSVVKSLKLNIDSLKVEQRMHFTTSLVEKDDPEDFMGSCDGLETYVVIESSESPEKIAKLIEISERACLALNAIANKTPTKTTVRLNGTDI